MSNEPFKKDSPVATTGMLLWGQYLLDAVAYRLGFGTAWRAFDTKADANPVLVIAYDDEALDREHPDYELIEQTAAFDSMPMHPSILPIIDSGFDVELNINFRVHPFATPRTLADYLAKGFVPLEAMDRLSLVTNLVAAVAAAHSEGYIHGCITPDNICMSESYEGLIVNFFGRCPSGTEYHLPMLVPSYSAPEALSDAVISKSADVFSLGKLTYKILFGGSIDPYGGWIPSKAYKHQISPMTIGALSKATNGVLQRAVALEARDRWPDANAYLNALKGLTIPNGVRNL